MTRPTKRTKHLFTLQLHLDGEYLIDGQEFGGLLNGTVVEVEIEAYTLNAAKDHLGRALTKLCTREP